MNARRYSAVMLVAFTIYDRAMFGDDSAPNGLAYVESLVPALIGLLTSLPLVSAIPPILRRENPSIYILPAFAGLATITLLGVYST